MTDFRCGSGKWCVARTPDGAAVTARADTLCSRCVDGIQSNLDELEAVQEALRLFIGHVPRTAGASKVNASREPQVPMNLRAFDLIEEIYDVLDRAGGGAIRVRDLITQPAEEFEVWLRDSPRDMFLTGVQRALDIRRVWQKADAVLGFSPVWERRHAPCPQCGQATLGCWSGSGQVLCTNSDCMAAFSWKQYEEWCVIQAKGK